MFANSGVKPRTVRFRAGDTVFRQGAPSTGIYVLTAGQVRLVRTLRDGTEVTITSVSAGESFAEAALFSDCYHCDAVAEEACEAQLFSCKVLRQRFASDPVFARELAAFLARQVRDLRSRLEIRNIKLASERVIAWLQMSASGKPPTVRLARPWSAVAGEIGLTPEATYRALSDLERAGQIIRRGKRTVILKS